MLTGSAAVGLSGSVMGTPGEKTHATGRLPGLAVDLGGTGPDLGVWLEVGEVAGVGTAVGDGLMRRQQGERARMGASSGRRRMRADEDGRESTGAQMQGDGDRGSGCWRRQDCARGGVATWGLSPRAVMSAGLGVSNSVDHDRQSARSAARAGCGFLQSFSGGEPGWKILPIPGHRRERQCLSHHARRQWKHKAKAVSYQGWSSRSA